LTHKWRALINWCPHNHHRRRRNQCCWRDWRLNKKQQQNLSLRFQISLTFVKKGIGVPPKSHAIKRESTLSTCSNRTWDLRISSADAMYAHLKTPCMWTLIMILPKRKKSSLSPSLNPRLRLSISPICLSGKTTTKTALPT
jgi:hypothetical protein